MELSAIEGEGVREVSVITLRVDPELRDQCRSAAEDADLSLNRWVAGVLRDHFARQHLRSELLSARESRWVPDGTLPTMRAELVAELAEEAGAVSAGFDAEMRVRFQVPNVGDQAALSMSTALHEAFGAEILRWNPAARVVIDGPHSCGGLPLKVRDRSEMDNRSGSIYDSYSGMGSGWDKQPGWYEDR